MEMVSDKEIEAAIKAIEAVPIMGDTYSLSGEDAKAAARAALEAAARVRAEADAEGGEPEGELCKCAPAFHEHDEAGAKHCRSCDAEWHPAPQPSGPVATLERGDGKGGWIIPVDVLSEIQKDAGEWADETYLETVEAIALAVERRLSALTAGKPEQVPSGWKRNRYECPTCGGSGEIAPDAECPDCDGTGACVPASPTAGGGE